MNKRKRYVWIVGFAGALGILIFFVSFRLQLRQHLESVNCGNQMSSIGIGARFWATDNNGYLPKNFLVMSNELNTPILLICPADRSRRPATNWNAFSESNCSYEILTPGFTNDQPDRPFFRCRLHGHLGYADGTVFDGKKRRTKALW